MNENNEIENVDAMNLTDEEIFEFLAQFYETTTEELKKLIPADYDMDMWRAIVHNRGKYQLVAEVVSAKFCSAGLKIGDKYVATSGMVLDQEQSTAPICLGAMQELMSRSYAFFDRTRRPFKQEDIIRPITGMRCFDPGWKLGGGGTVEFEVRIEKVET